MSIYGVPVDKFYPSWRIVPRMELSKDVCKFLTAEFINETNTWMLEFFGVEENFSEGIYDHDQ